MCRFVVYKGSDPILLSKLILEPTHSILKQSFDARLRLDLRRPHNGDGFGIGYYTDPGLGPEPCIFTSTTPAWNCANLPRIASKTASPLIFAHVRATTEGTLSDDNCHPFCHGSIMFMHNGGIAAWKYIKRRFAASLADKWYLGVHGGTDSEWAFALFLDTLEQMGHNPSWTPRGGFGPTVLRQAMLKTIEQINHFITQIPQRTILEEDLNMLSLLNFAVTDGTSVVCTRYVNSKTDEAASLYYSSGTTWEDRSQKGNYRMDRRDKGADIVLVASEPLTFERESWVTVPTNSILTIHKQTVMVHPIMDENYNTRPYHKRSSKFAQDQGFLTNEKVASVNGPPTPSIQDGNDPRKQLGLAHSHLNGNMTSNLRNQVHSPAATPDKNANTELRRLALNTPTTAKQQETGNTKEKRTVMTATDNFPPQNGHQEYQAEEYSPETAPSHRFASGRGDPKKIARYFPELHN